MKKFLCISITPRFRCSATTEHQWGKGTEDEMIRHIISVYNNPDRELKFDFLTSIDLKEIAVNIGVYENQTEIEFHSFRFD